MAETIETLSERVRQLELYVACLTVGIRHAANDPITGPDRTFEAREAQLKETIRERGTITLSISITKDKHELVMIGFGDALADTQPPPAPATADN